MDIKQIKARFNQEEESMKVEITFEKVLRVSKVIEVTEEQLEQLECGNYSFC